MRHIIVEGMDGTGKTKLVGQLAAALEMPIHPKAVPSTGGPPADLDDWVEKSVSLTAGIFDRHAAISEPIYGPVIRGTMPGRFNDRQWLFRMRRDLAQRSIVVWCQPPWSVVYHNIMHGPVQMDGVLRYGYVLYTAYVTARQRWRNGPAYVYDYTRTDLETLTSRLRREIVA